MKTRLTLGSLIAVLLAAGLALNTAASQANLVRSQDESTTVTETATAATETPLPTPTRAALTGLMRVGATIANVATLPNAPKGCFLSMTSDSGTDSSTTCRILVIGDSIGNDLGWVLKRQLDNDSRLTFYVRGKASTGLSNAWFHDWTSQFPRMLSQYKAHLVIVMIGANDHQSMKVDGRVLPFGSAAWVQQYQAKVQRIASLATSRGAYIAWIGLPIMAPPIYNRSMQQINDLIRSSVTQIPGTAFIPTYDYFADTSGQFRERASVNGFALKLRGSDGIHFTRSGDDVLATFVIRQLNAVFHGHLYAEAPKVITG